jgi:hypothetical protein
METKPFSTATPVRGATSGVALVMTLITLSIVALLLVGFLSSMSLERQAAHAFADGQRAKLIAQGAVAHAVDLLRTNIPDPARLSQGPQRLPTGVVDGLGNMSPVNWVVNPGRLTVIRPNAAPQFIPLHTGAVTSAPDPSLPPDAASYDLNQPLPGQTTPVITGVPANGSTTAPPMRIAWVNLQQDPSSAPSASNPLVGRYAFWIDDECSRLNFNTALGKPPQTTGTMFGDQLANDFVTPLFPRGDNTTLSSGSGQRLWALGRPQSVNLDVLLASPSYLNADQLCDQVFFHGFNKYPEAIMNYVNLPGSQTAQNWYDQQKFNLSFYNRSPEFNVFGLSRLFTTYVPLSLEGGPTYQHPFMYNGILFLNSLFGTFGFTSTVSGNEDTGTINGGNVVNKEQIDLLMSYLERPWPGYKYSFVDKYGPAECTQIALNLLLMARMATSSISTDLTNFSIDYSFRSTSVNYSPFSTENPNATPERMYWSFVFPTKTNSNPPPTLMLPQTPGPHITEVRLFTQAVPANPAPLNNPAKLKGYTAPYYIQYWYEVEYYMHPGGPVVDIAQFPVRMDYFDIVANGGGVSGGSSSNPTQQFGPTNGTDTRATQNWNTASSLALLKVSPPAGTAIGPAGATFPGYTVNNRYTFTSAVNTVGSSQTIIPTISGSSYTNWSPLVFDAKQGSTVSVTIRFRPGMGILNAPARPRQMIPLGLTQDDTLTATFPINLAQPNKPQAVSWQINDPRLSWDKNQWKANVQGPGDPSTVGTPAAINRKQPVSGPSPGPLIEPDENSTEKSKFRYIERAPTGTAYAGYALDRPDEYDTGSRISSPGYWSLIHTGIQSSQPWRTLNLGPTSSTNDPPDYLLLDLIGATYPMVGDQFLINNTLPDSFNTISYMNSTAGQVNLNSRIYPQTPYFQPPQRTAPLTAVFKNLRTDNEVNSFVANINSYQSDQQFFSYVGELANVPGFLGSNPNATQWDQETLLRNMAGCLTTKSNTFGVWGVAQVIKKLPANQGYNQFEKGDQVTAEKRFYALVERYVWPGHDGVPGNGHLNTSGKWDRLAQQTAQISTSSGNTDTLFQLPGSPPLIRNASSVRLNLDTSGSYPIFDGPEAVSMDSYSQASLGAVRYQQSTLENAYNPPQPVIKYRVVYFKYLDE